MLDKKKRLIGWIVSWQGKTITYNKKMEIAQKFTFDELSRIYRKICMTPNKSVKKGFSNYEINCRKLLSFFANKKLIF